jgi:hypothetical protein
MCAGQQFVTGDAVGEDIGQRIGGCTVKLLGRHVGERSQERPLRRDAGSRGLREQGNPEVHNFHVAVAQQHDVGRLHITVNSAVEMSMVQTGGHLPHDVELLQ